MLTCAKLCIALYFDNGFPVKGMPEKCYCAEVHDKSEPPALPLYAHYYAPPQPEPDRPDNRAKVQYDDE